PGVGGGVRRDAGGPLVGVGVELDGGGVDTDRRQELTDTLLGLVRGRYTDRRFGLAAVLDDFVALAVDRDGAVGAGRGRLIGPGTREVPPLLGVVGHPEARRGAVVGADAPRDVVLIVEADRFALDPERGGERGDLVGGQF